MSQTLRLNLNLRREVDRYDSVAGVGVVVAFSLGVTPLLDGNKKIKGRSLGSHYHLRRTFVVEGSGASSPLPLSRRVHGQRFLRWESNYSGHPLAQVDVCGPLPGGPGFEVGRLRGSVSE